MRYGINSDCDCDLPEPVLGAVSGMVYEVPEPVNDPNVPESTEISAAVKPLTLTSEVMSISAVVPASIVATSGVIVKTASVTAAAATTIVKVWSSVVPSASSAVYVKVADVKTAVGFPANDLVLAVKVTPAGVVGDSE